MEISQQRIAKKHLKNPDDFEFLLPIFNRIRIVEAVEHLKKADIVCFSTYLWNFNLSIAIAKELKLINSGIVIVFGGHQIPKNSSALEKFLLKYSFIDINHCGFTGPFVLRKNENLINHSWHHHTLSLIPL